MIDFRIIRITDGFPVGIVVAKSERAAILKAHKAFGYDSHHRAFPATPDDVDDYVSGKARNQWAENMRMARINLRLARIANGENF